MTGFTTRPELLGTFGMVTSTHWLASAVGMSMLEKGGNAFDAAVAAGFALQVVEPHLNGPAGEVPILVAKAGSRSVKVICGQGPAPAAATIERYTGMGLDMVPGNGLLSATLPGAFDAWMLLLKDYGTMELADVLAPAIGMAKNGYPLVPTICRTIATVRDLFVNDWPTSAAVYCPGGKVPAPGSLFTNKGLARSYERVLKECAGARGGRDGRIEKARKIWAEGFVAEAVDKFCRKTKWMDVSGEPHGGLITGQDMAGWRASVESPLTYDYHGYTVCKTGPWGQGPVFLQQLALLKSFNLDRMSATDPDFVHIVTECSKLAFADREVFYGDPKFIKVPMDVLLSDAYNDERRKLVGETASFELRPGQIDGFGGPVIVGGRSMDGLDPHAVAHGIGEPTQVYAGTAQGIGEPTVAYNGTTKGDTVHVDVIDKDGNMVSATPSGGWLPSSPVIPELGFCLTNRGQMFWLDPRSPSALAPGKRPRTTLSPSLALRDGKPYLAFGTPGGDQQDQWTLHYFLRHVHFGHNLQEAIDAPGFHTDHLASSFYPRGCKLGHLAAEGRFPDATLQELARRGHDLDVTDDWSLGRATGAAKDGRLLKAGANPRFMQGYAVGR
jgi:gamma-glutamyltranspeptidase/glutathione hydrolase